MKKLTAFSTVVALSFSILNGMSVFASSPSVVDQVQNTSEPILESSTTSNYIKASGTIKEIKKNGETFTLIVEDQTKSETHLIVTDETLLLDNQTAEALQKQTLQKGARIDAYYDKRKPMLLIYPPRITPDFVIITGEEMGQVKVSKFDEHFISADHQLQLNLSEETILVNQQGEAITKEELSQKEWIVFYDVSTKSIPAQTTPTKIIALDNVNQTPGNSIQEGHDTTNSEKKMIPIRKIAEELGYKVEWQPETLSIMVSKENLSLQFTIGKKEYTYHDGIEQLYTAPELKDGRTYVSEEILEKL